MRKGGAATEQKRADSITFYSLHRRDECRGPRAKPAEFSNLSSDSRTSAKSLNSLNLSFLVCEAGE